jgi:phenylacetate-CoA ligase
MPSKKPHPSELEPIERASRSELQALQLERLRWSLAHAYENVPHYRATFDAAGVKPSDLKTLEDLAKFPFTLKKDLRDNYPFGMFAVPREKVVRCMRRAARPASRPWSATRRRTSTPGRP